MEAARALTLDSLELLARVRHSPLNDTLTGGRLVSVAAKPYGNRPRFSSHLHVGMEVGIMLSGTTERYYEDYLCFAEAGDVWLCGMWEPHGWLVRGGGASRVIVNFLPEYLGEETLGSWRWWAPFAAPPRERPRVTDPALRARVLAIAEEMAPEIQRLEEGWQEAVRFSLLKLLFVLCREWRPPLQTEEWRPKSRDQLGRLLPALVLLRERQGAGPNLKEAAAACNLQRSQFSALFRRTMGASFGQFRLRLRLAHAAQMLRETEAGVEEIAAQVGFSDGSHLHRFFVRQYGCTPAGYRNGRAS